MALSVIRFDMRAPGASSAENAERYAAALDMAEFAEDAGFDMCVVSEHHGVDDGFLPSPLVMAAAIAGRTRRIPLNVSALLVPLYDPVRLAEDIAVLDLVSGGRVSYVAGLGYRPEEYEALGKAWKRRGKLLDESLEVMLALWKGETVDHHSGPATVRPLPLSDPPMVMVGGSGPKGAERAARFGLSFFPAVGDESLAQHYRDECERLGRKPGMALLPSGPGTVFCSEDPDAAWERIGPHLIHDAVTYRSWQTDDIRSHVKSDGDSVESLREEGVYRILTPDEIIALDAELGPMGPITHHPLCGGMPIDEAWASIRLYAEEVLPVVEDRARR